MLKSNEQEMFRNLLRDRLEDLDRKIAYLEIDYSEDIITKEEYEYFFSEFGVKRLDLEGSYIYLLTSLRPPLEEEEIKFLINRKLHVRNHYLN